MPRHPSQLPSGALAGRNCERFLRRRRSSSIGSRKTSLPTNASRLRVTPGLSRYGWSVRRISVSPKGQHSMNWPVPLKPGAWSCAPLSLVHTFACSSRSNANHRMLVVVQPAKLRQVPSPSRRNRPTMKTLSLGASISVGSVANFAFAVIAAGLGTSGRPRTCSLSCNRAVRPNPLLQPTRNGGPLSSDARPCRTRDSSLCSCFEARPWSARDHVGCVSQYTHGEREPCGSHAVLRSPNQTP